MQLKKWTIRALAGCAILSAGVVGAYPYWHVDSVFYSDATYSNPVGGVSLHCSGARTFWGTKTNYIAEELRIRCQNDRYDDKFGAGIKR